jgi:adenylyltransferase/sulfurtransferase
MNILTEEEKVRYQRQLLLQDWDIETQERLKGLTAFVGGAGGSGSPIITQLALLGMGCIRICDFDHVELANLNRQFLHCVSAESRIGLNKAISAQKTVKNINPNIKTVISTKKIDNSNVDEIVGDSDIIYDSVDRYESKFILSKCATRKGIPHLFYGMLDINSFFFTFNPPKTPCFHCLFDETKVDALDNITSRIGAMKKSLTPVACPPVVLSTGFAVTESLKILLGIGEPAYNKFFLFLQKGNDKVAKGTGFLGMKFWMTDFFLRHSANYGFDWDVGWQNKFIEEIDLVRNNACKQCSQL